MNLFGVGASEALLVLVIALVVVGPQRFPEIARQGGRWYRIARRYTNEVMRDVRAAVDDIEQEVRAEEEEFRSIREIGDDFSTSLQDASEDLEREGTATRDALDSGQRAEGATPPEPREPATIRPSRRRRASTEGGRRQPAQRDD